MLTPVDIQNKVFKGGIGFDKRDVEAFMRELSADYEQLYRSNVELQDKVTTLNESLQHYRATEDSMQKALTISEKTAEETINAANDKARQINSIAEKKAEELLSDAKEELTNTKNEIFRLQKLHAQFKEQYSRILQGQLKLIDNEVVDIDLGEGFEYSGSFGSEERLGGGLGSLGDGGGYTGASSFDNRFERTNQEPTINRTSLNMDPFADAANGGGRFSRQTGKGFTANSNKKSAKNNDTAKTGLNMKSSSSSRNKVKKDFTVTSADAMKDTVTSSVSVATEEKVKVTPKKKAENKTVEETPIMQTSVETVDATQTTYTETTTSSVKVETVNPINESVQETVADNHQETVSHVQETVNETVAQETQSFDSNLHNTSESVIAGEVEEKVDESTLIGNDDDDDIGFNFIDDDVWVSDQSKEEENHVVGESSIDNTYGDVLYEAETTDNTFAGEVEEKIDESTLLSDNDDILKGFEFMEDDNESESDISFDSYQEETEDDTFAGEVEDRNMESTMLDSEDNYAEDFDFVVGNEEEEDDIPTIGATFGDMNLNVDFEQSSSNADDDIFVGDVESAINKSTMIGNDDNDSEGFNFL